MALTFAFPATTAFADDNDDDRRSHVSDRDKDDDDDDDDDDDKKKKKKKKKRDRDDDVELELERVVYNAKKNQLRVSGELDDFEGRAELTVTDTALGLELGTIRVRGDDDFSKSISLDGLPVPCRVTVSIGGESVSKKVKRAPDTCSKFTKTITGLVTDGPIPFATVSVTVGGVTYTTVADENGFYSLDVATATVEELIQIGATGTDPETGTPIEFVNLTGTFEQLLSDEPQNVTNVTTASYILAVEANGGTEPTTLAELQAAETAVDATELFELAAVIKLLVDDPNYVLPPGFNSVLDFASDSTAVSDFVATADPADVDQALEAILADSNLVVGFDENGIPDYLDPDYPPPPNNDNPDDGNDNDNPDDDNPGNVETFNFLTES